MHSKKAEYMKIPRKPISFPGFPIRVLAQENILSRRTLKADYRLDYLLISDPTIYSGRSK